MAFAHHHGVRFSGSKAAMTVPPDGPLEKDRCRRNDLQRRGPTPLGAAMRSIGLPLQTPEVLPQRGHGLSPPPRRPACRTLERVPSEGHRLRWAWLPPSTTASLAAEGCRPKGPRSASWPPLWLPGKWPACRGKRLVCLDFGTTSVLSKRLGVSCVTN
jgi:hypothetical protein